MMKFSIIVPVYNVNNYLKECVESILRQKYEDFEIILVDDGSTDGSSKLCDKLNEIDNRIKVLHKKNGGLSDARNTGLKTAIGDYVLFCDSDDIWNDEALLIKAKNCINEYKDPDIILFGGCKFFEETNVLINDPIIDINYVNTCLLVELIKYLIESDTYSMSACTKIINTHFLKSNSLYFTKDLLGEDLDWFINILIHAKKMKAIDSNCYFYRIRQGSITQSISSKYISDFLWILDKWIPFFKDSNFPEEILDIYFSIFSYTYITNMMNILKIKNRRERNKIYSEYRKYDYLLKYSINRKTNIVKKIYAIFGIKITSIAMKFYYENKTMKSSGDL